ncbi:helix-hairpin-helix domain-containing protein [uncultured Ferrimonas sp.]|uniref:ComEA family DNA-binding protein n=1 Tax=uncultured Ferrimonas sp. TaxID=432640 RepID=UPI00262377A6|nr:helix-hairpin-helix domain-containing protein [uncultured Ferrimonas sp.]
MKRLATLAAALLVVASPLTWAAEVDKANTATQQTVQQNKASASKLHNKAKQVKQAAVQHDKQAKAITKVNINTADAAQLAQALTGIGKSKANAIVEYRKNNGKFKSINSLSQVKGIGATLVAQNYDRIQL